jgi:hypothetical protein
MRDLRRRALESNKTVSRKARSTVASGASSKVNSSANSPAQSRAASRTRGHPASDDDEDSLSDGTAFRWVHFRRNMRLATAALNIR